MAIDGAGRSKPQVRSRVLRAALEAIGELGPDRVRIQDIATRAGMSSGHVMYYFGDRDRILLGTLLLSEGDLADRRDRSMARTADPWQAVDRLSRLYLPTGPHDVRWTLWAQTVARPPVDAVNRAALRDAVDSWSTCLAGVISRGIGSGAFRAMDTDAAAYRHCRLMDGLAIEVLLGAPGRGRQWAVDQSAAAWRALAATG